MLEASDGWSIYDNLMLRFDPEKGWSHIPKTP